MKWDQVNIYTYLYECRPMCWSHSIITTQPLGYKQIRMWNLQQGFPKRPKPSTSPARTQPSMEAQAKKQHWDNQKASLCMPRSFMCPPQPSSGTRWPYRNQEAFLPETRREEMEMWKMFKEVRCTIWLESSLQDLRYKRIQMWLWNHLLQVWYHH